MRLLPKRKMSWALLLWTAIFAIWIIGGIHSATNHACDYPGALSVQACQDATNAGAGIGAALIFFLWFISFVVLSLVWLITRPKHRTCPVCGEDVKKGRTACKKC